MILPDTDPKPFLPVARIRDVLLLGLGVAAGAAAITILSRIMRSVGEVGGSCADGGPYVSAQPCPDGTGPAILATVLLGFVCVGATLWGAPKLEAPIPLFWAWPALFFTLGWNFLEDGWIDPPAGAGISGGYLFCGVLFFLMAAAPLLLGWFALRQSARTEREAADRQRKQALTAVATTLSRRATPPRPPAPRVAVPAPTQPDDLPGGDAPDDAAATLAGRLERLAALHASGDLTDDEFRRAKSATLREEIDR
ncbi:SHOCT domain-containing protein [Blastococcus sp. URHD0036]|uniref:SHOCT domain-containing protein n=1 Tax=Blastococcus sp. URHD0036 TaxID=1380356 RepID=UPI000496A8A8|nr:SHOCT domain-containing protein [Blastococcus sp. URHD0036]